jgi:hypothetical protein
MNILLISRIVNIYLKVRYMIFRKYVKRKEFNQNMLILHDKFENLDNWNVVDNEFYNHFDVFFSKETVSLTPDGVEISCFHDPKERTTWQGTRVTNWTSGMIRTLHKVSIPAAIWVIEAKICDSFCAIWLLKDARDIDGFSSKPIIPEIDILENIRGWARHTIHYGYSDKEYRRFGIGTSVFPADNKWHEYAVECLPSGYNFYVDGILTGYFRSKNPEFVSMDPQYILINNAWHKYTKQNTIFRIKSVKIFKNNNHVRK